MVYKGGRKMKSKILIILRLFVFMFIVRLESSASPTTVANPYSSPDFSPIAKPSFGKQSNGFTLQQFQDAILADDIKRLDFMFKSSASSFAAGSGAKMPKISQNNQQFLNQPMLNLQGQMEMPLSIALRSGNLNMMKVLLKAGANPNLKASPQDAPLLFGAMQLHNPQAVDLLLIGGADPTVVNQKNGRTFVHAAVEAGNVEMLNSLINDLGRRGKLSFLNSQNSKGETPVFLAVKNDQPEMVRNLLANQADAKIPNLQGKTPEQLSIEKNFSDIELMIKDANHQKIQRRMASVDATLKENTRAMNRAEQNLKQSKLNQISMEHRRDARLLNQQAAYVEGLPSERVIDSRLERARKLTQKSEFSSSPVVEQVQLASQVSQRPVGVEVLSSERVVDPRLERARKLTQEMTALEDAMRMQSESSQKTQKNRSVAIKSVETSQVVSSPVEQAKLINPVTETSLVVYKPVEQQIQSQKFGRIGGSGLAGGLQFNNLQLPVLQPQVNVVASQGTAAQVDLIESPIVQAKSATPAIAKYVGIGTAQSQIARNQQQAEIGAMQTKNAINSRNQMIEGFNAKAFARAKAQQAEVLKKALQAPKPTSAPRGK